jgi:hypothetical protein
MAGEQCWVAGRCWRFFSAVSRILARWRGRWKSELKVNAGSSLRRRRGVAVRQGSGKTLPMPSLGSVSEYRSSGQGEEKRIRDEQQVRIRDGTGGQHRRESYAERGISPDVRISLVPPCRVRWWQGRERVISDGGGHVVPPLTNCDPFGTADHPVGHLSWRRVTTDGRVKPHKRVRRRGSSWLGDGGDSEEGSTQKTQRATNNANDAGMNRERLDPCPTGRAGPPCYQPGAPPYSRYLWPFASFALTLASVACWRDRGPTGLMLARMGSNPAVTEGERLAADEWFARGPAGN